MQDKEKNSSGKEVTRELTRIADSTFLYTELFPIELDSFIKINLTYTKNIKKQGVLKVSSEMMLDTVELLDFDTGETIYNKEYFNLLKPSGKWIENKANGSRRITGYFDQKGKTGLWIFYNRNYNLSLIHI